MLPLSDTPPGLDEISAAAAALEGRIIRTPTVALRQSALDDALGHTGSAFMKLELFQHAGSFKARGNLLGIDRLNDDQRQAGVVAASGGNHALALSWAAASQGVPAILVMPRKTDRLRVESCVRFGAEVRLVDTVMDAMDAMDSIAKDEGRTVMHPYEAAHMTLGAATLGAEILEDLPDIDCMVVSVGGGGLISGVAAAIGQAKPGCEIIGVEPFGADSLWRSFEKGEAVQLETVDTIADSLGAPTALPYSFSVARAFVDRVVRVDDAALVNAMVLMRDGLKLVAEPACAAALAAAVGPLREDLEGRNICLLACGSNISAQRHAELLSNS